MIIFLSKSHLFIPNLFHQKVFFYHIKCVSIKFFVQSSNITSNRLSLIRSFLLFWFLFAGCYYRWSWPFSWSTCISCSQKSFARWQNRHCTMRRIDIIRSFLQVKKKIFFLFLWRFHVTLTISYDFIWISWISSCFLLIKKYFFFSNFRNKVKYLNYLRKRCNVNPARGPFHFRAPCRIFYKAVRGNYTLKCMKNMWTIFSAILCENVIRNETNNVLMMINIIYLHYLILFMIETNSMLKLIQ